MSFTIKNTHLDITEIDVKECKNLRTLRDWKENITKQIIVMDNKIRNYESKELMVESDRKDLDKTIHAKNLQQLMITMIDNKIDDIKEENKNSHEALFYTIAEMEMSPAEFDRLENLTYRALQNGEL